MNNNIKGIFFDFDWTLFDHKTKSFIPSAIKAINDIQKQGVKIFINSARSYFSLKGLKTFENLNFDGYSVSNGGAAFLKNEVLYAHYLNKEKVKEIRDILDKHNVSYMISTLKTAYIKNVNNDKNVKTFYEIFYEPYPKDIKDYKDEDVLAIQVYIAKDKDFILDEIKGVTKDRFFDCNVEITTKLFSKKEGIEAIINHYGYKKEEIAAFGDDVNDIDMFNHVKYGICLGNGKEEVKPYAYFVTTNIEDDGILNGLKHLGLIDEK